MKTKLLSLISGVALALSVSLSSAPASDGDLKDVGVIDALQKDYYGNYTLYKDGIVNGFQEFYSTNFGSFYVWLFYDSVNGVYPSQYLYHVNLGWLVQDFYYVRQGSNRFTDLKTKDVRYVNYKCYAVPGYLYTYSSNYGAYIYVDLYFSTPSVRYIYVPDGKGGWTTVIE